MSLPPSGGSFEGLQASQSIEGSNSEQPQEEPPQISPRDEEYPEDSDASISSGEYSEEELRRMAEADGKRITEILTIFTKQLKVVETNTEKMAEHGRHLTKSVAEIAMNSQNMHETLAAVEASMTEMQTSMTAMQERNRLHETGTHSIRFHTQEMAKEAEKMSKEMDLHQIANFKQHSTIIETLLQVNERLDRLNNGQQVARGASLQAVENAALTPGTCEKSFVNLSLNPILILTAFMLILVFAAFKYYEIIQIS